MFTNEGRTIFGTDKNDIYVTGLLNDTIFGNKGNDTIKSGNGADVIFGGNGNDYINAGKGNDTIFSGSGKDTFIFKRNDGHDTIMDFDLRKDKIILDVSENTIIEINDMGFYVSIVAGNTTIDLLNVDPGFIDRINYEII